jgi:protein Tob/BTG
VNLFGEALEKGLKKKFEGHWYPERPCKGSGFRCVRVNGENLDPVTVVADVVAGVVVVGVVVEIVVDFGEMTCQS